MWGELMKPIATSMCILVLAGCTDLAAVRDISSRLTVASNDWNDVGRDIAGSCQRELTLNPMIKDCELAQTASKGLVDADEVLHDYFKALMAAATETNFTVQPGLDKATTSVAAIPGIDKAQVTAVSGLVGLLVRLSLEKMREDTLRALIGEGGPAAQTVVEGFSQLVVPSLKSRLGSEKVQLTGYFARAILTQGDRVGSDPEALCSGSAASKFSGTGLLLTLEYCERLAIVQKREKALDDYDASLKAASKALAELQSSKTDLKAKALAQKLYAIGSELDDKVAAVRKAFG